MKTETHMKQSSIARSPLKQSFALFCLVFLRMHGAAENAKNTILILTRSRQKQSDSDILQWKIDHQNNRLFKSDSICFIEGDTIRCTLIQFSVEQMTAKNTIKRRKITAMYIGGCGSRNFPCPRKYVVLACCCSLCPPLSLAFSIYLFVCVCVCVCLSTFSSRQSVFSESNEELFDRHHHPKWKQ